MSNADDLLCQEIMTDDELFLDEFDSNLGEEVDKLLAELDEAGGNTDSDKKNIIDLTVNDSAEAAESESVDSECESGDSEYFPSDDESDSDSDMDRKGKGKRRLMKVKRRRVKRARVDDSSDESDGIIPEGLTDIDE